MIILGLVVLACCYTVGFVSQAFELNSRDTYRLMVWSSTFVVGSLLLYLSSGAHN